MKIFLSTLLFLISLKALAMPEKVEIWFLSAEKLSNSKKYIFDYLNFKFSGTGIKDDITLENCIPMGGGCFHPQFGFFPKRATVLKEDSNEILKKKMDAESLKTFNAIDVDLVKCNKEYYFDLYCGKAKKIKPISAYEIWIDTSSSMRNVDYSNEKHYCFRRSLIDVIDNGCRKKNVSFSIFNTSIKALGSAGTACQNYGNNDGRRMIDWISGSTAKHLIIVTDIDELTMELSSFIEQEGIKTTGVGAKSLHGKDLINMAKNYVSKCDK